MIKINRLVSVCILNLNLNISNTYISDCLMNRRNIKGDYAPSYTHNFMIIDMDIMSSQDLLP